jgi:sulfate adenylyltransferase
VPTFIDASVRSLGGSDVPSWTLTADQHDDVVLVLAGVDLPLTLQVDDEVARAAEHAGALALRDLEGTVVAQIDVAAVEDGCVRGHLVARTRPAPVAFTMHHLDVAAVRPRAAGAPITVVQPRHTPGPAALARWQKAVGEAGHLVVQPVLAHRPEAAWAAAVRALRVALRSLPADRVTLQLLPLPGGDGPGAAERRALAAHAVDATVVLDDRATPDDPPTAAVQAEVDRRVPAAGPGVVVLFTGLSGSGKSTLARALRGRLLEEAARTITLLDGDLVRRELSKGLGFSREDREANVRRIGWVAAEIARHGGVAICAPIAPEDRVRRAVRADVEEAGGRFVLVHVATPIEVCEARDVKGLYARARAGELTGFTGIDDPYEVPADAEVVVDTSVETTERVLTRVLAAARLSGSTTIASTS